jgi:class 3 adenylate cyclase
MGGGRGWSLVTGEPADRCLAEHADGERMRPRPAVHRTIFVVDVEGFGNYRRTNQHQVMVRDGMYRVLRRALRDPGIPWSACDHEDRGDGVLLLAPAEVPKGRFVELLPRKLAEALREHNSLHGAEEQIRLRIALHAGEINYDDHGVAATSVNFTFRILEAGQLKAALAGSPGVLALKGASPCSKPPLAPVSPLPLSSAS